MPVTGLQRKCACSGTHGLSDDREERRTKKLQRKTTQRSTSGTQFSEVPPIVHEVLRSPGRPLDAATRAFMEPRFGYDFSRVRVHTNARAAESAGAVDASAYAVGNHLVFDAGRYSPRTSAGQKLLAHELAHVIQQRISPDTSVPIAIDQSPSLEYEASVAETTLFAAGLPVSTSSHSPVVLSRQRVAPTVRHTPETMDRMDAMKLLRVAKAYYESGDPVRKNQAHTALGWVLSYLERRESKLDLGSRGKFDIDTAVIEMAHAVDAVHRLELVLRGVYPSTDRTWSDAIGSCAQVTVVPGVPRSHITRKC